MLLIQMQIVKYSFCYVIHSKYGNRVSFLIHLNHDQQERDSVVFLVVGFYVTYAYGVVLGNCELGQQASNAFDGIDIKIETFDWYLFSLEIQRMLHIILIEAQENVEIKCFGSISVSRETATKVSRNLLVFCNV